MVRRPAGLPAMGYGICVQEAKTAGVWVKKELKLILPKVKTTTSEYQIFPTFQDIHFLFYDYIHLSNV
jgi:hypothetical protein